MSHSVYAAPACPGFLTTYPTIPSPDARRIDPCNKVMTTTRLHFAVDRVAAEGFAAISVQASAIPGE